MEKKILNKIKTYNIEVEEDIHLYQAYISSINWMLGKNMLSSSEIEVLSYFLYYNNKYSSIEDMEVRYELLFSSTTKRKIRDQFNINSQKLEGYITKLKKKGIIINNRVSDMFIVYPKGITHLMFNFSIKKELPKNQYTEEQLEVDYKPLPYDYTTEEDDNELEEEIDE